MSTTITSPTVSSSSTVTTGTSSTSTSSANTTEDRFLTLLVAQLNNQDPMNPMDNAAMTSQIAQIDTATGVQKVNDTLKSMGEQFAAMQSLQGTTMVGHNVLTEGNSLVPIDGVAEGAIDLAGRAESVKIDILSPGGQVVDTISAGALDAGRHYFNWDATNYTAGGTPTFKVTATLGGKAIEATPLTVDRVVSVGVDNGAMTVQLQGRGATAYSSVKAIL